MKNKFLILLFIFSAIYAQRKHDVVDSIHFKGEPKEKIKIFSRMFTDTYPLLILDEEYLIFFLQKKCR